VKGGPGKDAPYNAMRSSERSPWLQAPADLAADAPVAVFFPYAGGSAATFRSWAPRMHGCAFVGVELPGRGRRFEERRITDIELVVAGVCDALDAYRGHRLAFFGHSLGGLIAFEVARCLTTADREIDLLVVSGCRAPQTGLGRPPIAHLTDEGFLTAALDLGLASRDLAKDEELRRHYLPVLRADISMAERYRYRPRPPLSVPTAAFGGRSDPHVPEPVLLAWGQLVERPLEVRWFAGDHMFVHTEQEAVLAAFMSLLR
jgi:surfactin synthase thioesterase subunit